MKRFLEIIGILSIISAAAFLLINGIDKNEADPKPYTHPTYNIQALELPNNLNLAGEPVPLDIPDVKERMERELLVNTYWQSNGILLLKRANKYFPILEPLLKKYR